MNISICVPIYGVEKYIERCAISLFEQTYKSIEYIFVNDCTKDNSIDILNKTIEKYPEIKKSVRIIHHDVNKGLAGARNTAVDAATGEFILHVDSDDYLEIDGVERLMKLQAEGDYDMIPTALHVIMPVKEKIREYPIVNNGKALSLLLLSRCVPLGVAGKLIRRSLYTENNIKAIEGVNLGEDYQVTPRLAYFADRVSVMNDYIYNYDCTNEGSYTATFSLPKMRQVMQAFQLLSSFFKDKGSEYEESLCKAKVKIMYTELSKAGLTSISVSDFNALRKEANTIPKDNLKVLSLPRRLLFYIGNRHMLSAYVKLTSTLYRILQH